MIATIVFALAGQCTHAQERAKAKIPAGYFGPTAGLGHSWVHNLPGNTSYQTQKSLGIKYIGLLTKHWGVGANLVVSSEGYQVNYLNTMQSFTPIYLRMPVRLYYFFGKPGNMIRPDIYVGPSVAVKLDEQISASAAYRDLYKVSGSDNFSLFDAGVNGGAGLNIRLAKNIWLNMDMGFYTGFTDAVEDMGKTYNPQSDVDFNLGLLFGLR
ncbi:MAG: hypothetical protein K0Q79_650 [Flavipsychrobacter sp.]|nr:hypothetical protein [Flavipsychrobacter sp.]